MGTRSLTEVQDESGAALVTIYQQFDGYPSGAGNDLKEKFGEIVIVNGISGDRSKVANGLGCLAAQVVRDLKDDVGGTYIQTPGARDCGEEYVYVLKAGEERSFDCAVGPIYLDVYGGPVTFFGGSSEIGATKPIWSGLLKDFDPEEAEVNYAKAMDEASDAGEDLGPKRYDQPAA